MMHIVGVGAAILVSFGVTWLGVLGLEASYSDHFPELVNEKKPYIRISNSNLTEFKAKLLKDHGYIYYGKEEGPFGGDFLLVHYYKFTGEAAKSKDK